MVNLVPQHLFRGGFYTFCRESAPPVLVSVHQYFQRVVCLFRDYLFDPHALQGCILAGKYHLILNGVDLLCAALEPGSVTFEPGYVFSECSYS